MSLTAVVCATGAVILGSRLYMFRQNFVFVTVEESSTEALVSWPLLWDKYPQVFFDIGEKVLEAPQKISLAGVSLALYYSAISQGIEYHDDLSLSRTGKATLSLLEPLSLTSRNWDGDDVELVDNWARVLRGNLKVTKTTADGIIHLSYGGRKIVLEPGESWAELIIQTPDGIVEADASHWADLLADAMKNDWPATRLAIANLGLWPKSGVEVGVKP